MFRLVASGYEILARNYRCPVGEVDVVAKDGDTVVFVEVRSLLGGDYGDPLSTVTKRKQRRVAKAALHYLTCHDLLDRPARFDVAAVKVSPEGFDIELVKDAFDSPL